RSFQDEKKLFVGDFLESGEVGGDLDGSELASLCASKHWYPEEKAVIVSCEPVPGGLASVKNGALNCVRFAIEIGGASTAQLILPRIALRSVSDISNLHGAQQNKGAGLDYMFSVPQIRSALQAHCPQLKVHDSLDALYDRPSLLKPLDLGLSQLTREFISYEDIPTTILAQPQNLSSFFQDYLDSNLPPEKRHYPVRVHLANTLFAWPAHEAGTSSLRSDFGKLLRTRDDVKALAASALYNLAKVYSLPLPSPRSDRSAAQTAESLVGMHLRTEKDARDSWSFFPGYDDQTAYFFAHLESLPTLPPPPGAPPGKKGRKLAYLATGLTATDSDVVRFRARAAELDTTVLLKRDLLDETEVAALNRLTWDQRALVDYEILLRAGTVLGIVESSFAWDVALRRAMAYTSSAQQQDISNSFTARPGTV
ncbi:hypothetical protein M406DRAFT_239083, partial [Cryphonectria parasitica EP155]